MRRESGPVRDEFRIIYIVPIVLVVVLVVLATVFGIPQ